MNVIFASFKKLKKREFYFCKFDKPQKHDVERQLPLNDRLRKFSTMNIFKNKIMNISNIISQLMLYFGCKYVLVNI